jgi:hypothetical protein
LCATQRRRINRYTSMRAAARSLQVLPALRLRQVRRTPATAAGVPKGHAQLQREQLTSYRLVCLSRCPWARARRLGTVFHPQSMGAWEVRCEFRVRSRDGEAPMVPLNELSTIVTHVRHSEDVVDQALLSTGIYPILHCLPSIMYYSPFPVLSGLEDRVHGDPRGVPEVDDVDTELQTGPQSLRDHV